MEKLLFGENEDKRFRDFLKKATSSKQKILSPRTPGCQVSTTKKPCFGYWSYYKNFYVTENNTS